MTGAALQSLRGGGEMGALMRAVDWAATPLGPIEAWPQSLRTAASIILRSRFPMYIAWGPRYIQLYNDGYRPILGTTKHPSAMGQPASECFRESWQIIGPMFDGVMRGDAVGSEDWLLPLDRNGYLEDCYFTFSYSPIGDESGGVGGVLVTVNETTARVLGERRLHTLRGLAAKTLGAADVGEACRAAIDALATNPNDLPFALVYLAEGEQARLAGSTGLTPTAIDLEDSSFWPFADCLRAPKRVDNLGALLRDASQSADSALILPILHPSNERPNGFLVAGLSRRRALDEDYQSFLTLVAGNISMAIVNATARDDERKRAATLAELDRAKTTFFSNVSHEFRTPLTLMLAPIQDMLGTPEGTPVDHAAVELLHRNAIRLLKLVNTLLEFSRIEAGRVDAVYEPVDLSAMTSELASGFRAAIERAGLRLVVDCPPLPEEVWVDREMWEKIVLNLLSNAFKFTFDGSITVRLHTEGARVRLDVEDTGTGIAEAELPRLFERFHRIEGARSRSHEGSGIGLALIEELVRLHGGTVRARSRLGEGTTFSVFIPYGVASLPPARVQAARALPSTAVAADAYVSEALRWEAPSSDPPPAPPATAPDPRERIVFADDNADMRDYVRRLLGERWSVEAVADGDAALASIRRDPPKLVLCDIMMPKLDGLGLVRAMRADPALRAIPIIILSARAGEEETAKGLSFGANDYIAKPFSARELLVRVASALAASRVAGEIRAIEATQRANLYRHFMQAPFPIAVFKGPRHVVELANPLTLHAWGKGREVIGLPLQEAVPELRGQPLFDWLDRVYRTGVSYEGKDQLAALPTGPEGAIEEIYCNFVYAPLRDVDGAVEGVLLSAFLVTDEVRARRRLEAAVARAESSEAQLRDLVDNLPELAWNARPDGFIDFYNRRWYEYTGTTLDQMQGWGWESVHDPEKLPQIVARWKQSLATGSVFEMEFALRRADGVFRWFLTRAIPLRDARGQIVRWFGTNTDVDEARRERERAEALAAELAHTTQRLHAAQRAAMIGIFDWDLAAERVSWSPEIFRLMGLEPGAINPTPEAWTAALIEEDRDVGWQSFRRATSARAREMEVEVRLRQPSGEGRWVRLSTEIEYDPAGTPVRLLGAVIDIQALKEAAAVRARALEEAERISRAKDEFLATMSHELRTPLNAMLGWATMLKNDPRDRAKVDRGLAIIERNARTQTRLISDLLDVSRVISGKLRLTVTLTEVSAVIHAALDVVRQAADAKGVRLVVNLDPDTGTLVADPDRLQQVVWNLLSNAVRFTPARGSVTVTAGRVDSMVRITVADTGPGIPSEHLPFVFDRFRQIDGSTTRAHGGLGLGLAIVRHLVEAHGGTVTVRSDGPGAGATFTVSLPIHATHAVERDVEKANGEPRMKSSPPGADGLRGRTILVIDDDEDSRELLLTVLEEAGVRATGASNAREALEATSRTRFDVLISDIGMPEMDGYAFLLAVRAKGDRAPAIALTAYARAEDAARAREVGYEEHLVKPVDVDKLLATIERMLHLRNEPPRSPGGS